MSETTTDQQPISAQVGDTIHVLVSGLTVDARIWCRGDQIKVDADLIESTRDVNGWSWLDDLSEAGQTARWRRPMLSIGPRPTDFEQWVYGSPEWEQSREKARREAWTMPTEALRVSALHEVERRYGKAPVSSKVTNSAPDPSIAQAERQETARRAEGVRQFSHYEPSRREA